MFTATDAIRMAEESFKVKHLNTAINHARSIKRLDPLLQNTADQLIAAYKVHAAAANKVSIDEEPDWYEVLGTSYNACSDDIIKKQYRKLVILVHPDKNKSSAAEDAFKLISEAYDILSDPKKKSDYDLRCGFSAAYPFGRKECPRCSGPCPYETQQRSSIYCLICDQIFVFKNASASRWEYNSFSSTGRMAEASSSRSPKIEIQCPCAQGQCLIVQSHTKKNPGREFYRCPSWKDNDCGFFLWVDEYKMCPCNRGPCKVLTSKQYGSVGQRFYVCPISKAEDQEDRGCGYFSWVKENVEDANPNLEQHV